MARKATVWSCWHLYCSIYAAAHWTDCDLCTGTGSQAQSTGREKCCRQQGNQPQSTCNVCSSVLHSLHGAYYDSGIRMHSRRKRMFERCRQATQQSTCKKETRRACGAGLSVSEELAMLGSHHRNTVHDTTVPAAAVICNLLAQQHAHHACFGVLVRSNRPALCSLYMAESECCTNPVYASGQPANSCNCTT
jgi:hypothetical protein